LVEKLDAARAFVRKECQTCPEERFPPVRSQQRTSPLVEGASAGQSQAASGEFQPPAGAPARRTHDDDDDDDDDDTAARGGGG
jgi:hypothetical protein